MIARPKMKILTNSSSNANNDSGNVFTVGITVENHGGKFMIQFTKEGYETHRVKEK